MERPATEEKVDNGTTEETPKTEPENTDTADSSAETENTDTTPSEKDKQVAETVPYNRFAEVNKKWHDSEKEMGKVTAELESTKQQLASLQKKEDVILDDPNLTDEDKRLVKATYEKAVKPVINTLVNKIVALEDRLVAQEESVNIEKELTRLKGLYPDMDEKAVKTAYIEQGDVTLEEVAAKSQEDEKAKETKIIEKYRQTKKKESEHKGGTPPGTSPSVGSDEPPKGLTFGQRIDWRRKQADKFLQSAQ